MKMIGLFVIDIEGSPEEFDAKLMAFLNQHAEPNIVSMEGALGGFDSDDLGATLMRLNVVVVNTFDAQCEKKH